MLALLLALSIMLPCGVIAAQESDGETVTLTHTSPRANVVLRNAPETVILTFSADIAPEMSDVRILAADGTDLAGMAPAWSGASGIVALPEGLAHGSWLVAWRVTAIDSDADGSGFFGFTVGTDQDVSPLTIPDTGFQPPAAATWLARLASAALVLGTLVLIAVWPLWMPRVARAPIVGIHPIAPAGDGDASGHGRHRRCAREFDGSGIGSPRWHLNGTTGGGDS